MKVAALQVNSGEVMEENLTTADGLICQAVESGAELVVLADIDVQSVRNQRRRFPVLTHRRL